MGEPGKELSAGGRRRKFLQQLFGVTVAGVGAAAGLGGSSQVPDSLAATPQPPDANKREGEQKVGKEFRNLTEVLGEGYTTTRLDPEGYLHKENFPRLAYDVKSTGRGFTEVPEDQQQGGFFYLSGARDEGFPHGASVSMQVLLCESVDRKKRYLVFGVDNGTYVAAGVPVFNPTTAEYSVTFPSAPFHEVGDTSIATQKEAEQGGVAFTVFNEEPQIPAEKFEAWEHDGRAQFMIVLQDPDMPGAINIIPGQTYIPTELTIHLHDTAHSTSIRFVANKRPEQ